MENQTNDNVLLLCKECGNETNIKYYTQINKECLMCFNCGTLIKIEPNDEIPNH